MKRKELIWLLNRGAAAIETPGDLTDEERDHVVEDLAEATAELNELDDDVHSPDLGGEA